MKTPLPMINNYDPSALGCQASFRVPSVRFRAGFRPSLPGFHVQQTLLEGGHGLREDVFQSLVTIVNVTASNRMLPVADRSE